MDNGPRSLLDKRSEMNILKYVGVNKIFQEKSGEDIYIHIHIHIYNIFTVKTQTHHINLPGHRQPACVTGKHVYRS